MMCSRFAMGRLSSTLAKPKAKAWKYVPKKLQTVREIDKYLSEARSKRAKVNEVPARFKNCLAFPPESLICIDKKTANLIATAVSENISTGSLLGVPIIEMAPGPGLISKILLEKGADHLRLYEPQPQLNGQIQNLATKNPTKVQVLPYDLHNLARVLYLDQVTEGTQMDEIMIGIKPKQPPEITNVVIGACPNRKFLKLLAYMVAYDLGFPHYGQTEYFIAMHPYNYLRMTSGPKDGYYRYRYHTVAFQLFYSCKLLMKLDRKTFLSWEKEYTPTKYSKQKKLFSTEQEYLYFVQITPKPLTYKLKNMEKQQLWYFLKHHMVSRTAKVVPLLQQWIPECQERLISLDITEETAIGELSPDQIFALFKAFVSWPEFPHCSFNTSMEMSYLKSNLENIQLSSVEKQ